MTLDKFPEFLGAAFFLAGSLFGYLLLMKWSYELFGLPAIAIGLMLIGFLMMGIFEGPSSYSHHPRRGPP